MEIEGKRRGKLASDPFEFPAAQSEAERDTDRGDWDEYFARSTAGIGALGEEGRSEDGAAVHAPSARASAEAGKAKEKSEKGGCHLLSHHLLSHPPFESPFESPAADAAAVGLAMNVGGGEL